MPESNGSFNSLSLGKLKEILGQVNFREWRAYDKSSLLLPGASYTSGICVSEGPIRDFMLAFSPQCCRRLLDMIERSQEKCDVVYDMFAEGLVSCRKQAARIRELEALLDMCQKQIESDQLTIQDLTETNMELARQAESGGLMGASAVPHGDGQGMRMVAGSKAGAAS